MEQTLDDELGLISEAEYARFVNKKITTVRNERSAGKAPPYTKVGKTIKYYREGIKQLVAANTVTSKRPPTLTEGRARRGRRT